MRFDLPPGFVAVLRSVTVVNTVTAIPGYYGISVQPADITVVSGHVAPEGPENTERSEAYDLRFVFYPTEYLLSQNDVSIDLTASGYVFEAPTTAVPAGRGGLSPSRAQPPPAT